MEQAKSSKESFWDKSAIHYDTFLLIQKQSYKLINQQIKKHLNDKMKVLDIGCGTGNVARYMAPFVDQVIACDNSMNMITIAKEKTNNKKNANIRFDITDANHLPYEDQTFDVVTLVNTLHVLADPKEALKEAKRVLKADGTLIVPNYVFQSSQVGKGAEYVSRFFGYNGLHRWSGLSYQHFIESQHLHVIQRGYISGILPIQYIAVKQIKAKSNMETMKINPVWTRRKNTRRSKQWNKTKHGKNMTSYK